MILLILRPGLAVAQAVLKPEILLPGLPDGTHHRPTSPHLDDFILFISVFQNRTTLCSLDSPGIPSIVDQAVLELTKIYLPPAPEWWD